MVLVVSYTFGAGGFFANLGAFVTWVSAHGGGLGDDFTLVQVGHSVEDIHVGLNFNYGGHSLTITSNVDHKGDPNAGYWIDFETYNQYMDVNPHGGENLYFEDLKIKGGTTTGIIEWGGFFSNSILHFRRCLIKGGVSALWYDSIPFNSAPVEITDCVIWGSSSYSFRFDTPGGNSGINGVIENNCFLNAVTTGRATFRNNYFRYGTGGGGAGYNNKCSEPMTDGSWGPGSSGNSGGIVESHEFESTSGTSPDFAKLRDGAILASAGIAPTLITQDIAGRSLPFMGNYPVGPHAAGYMFGADFDYVPEQGPAPLTVNFEDKSGEVWL
jgi:hypothetical protein